MIRVKYPSRIVCTAGFIKWLIDNKDERWAADMILHLMYVNNSSDGYKEFHNVILQKELNSVQMPTKELKRFLKGGITEVPNPEFLEENDVISANLRYAVDLTSDPPWSALVLVSPDELEQYKNNSHGKKDGVPLNNLQILSGNEARAEVSVYMRVFTIQRQASR